MLWSLLRPSRDANRKPSEPVVQPSPTSLPLAKVASINANSIQYNSYSNHSKEII